MKKLMLLFVLLLLSQDGTFVITDGIIDVRTNGYLYGSHAKKWELEIIYPNYTKYIYYGSGEKWALEEDYYHIMQAIKYERRVK